MIIKRKLFEKIENYSQSKQAIVVTGMRRVGKTTLLKYFYENISSLNKLFLDLENPLNQSIFCETNYETIRTSLEKQGLDFSTKAFVFLDEIQFLPNLPSIVKYFYDHYDIKFFLTGSASFYLKNLFSESLAGRKYIFELFPLDFEEFIWFKGLNYKLPTFNENISKSAFMFFAPLVEEYLHWGAMPEIVLLKNPKEKELAIKDIFSSYFQKEIQTLGDFKKNEAMRNLIFLLTKRIGQKLDIQKISQELAISRQTVYEYLEFLNATYFIFLVPAIGKVDIASRKQRKIYLIDTGFARLLEAPSKSLIFENAVFLNLILKGEVSYFEKNRKEIDFIVNLSEKNRMAIEVKETATVSDIKKVNTITAAMPVDKACIVSFNYSPDPQVKYIFQLPNSSTIYDAG